jgi:exosortase
MKLFALSQYKYTLVTLLLLTGISLIFKDTAFSYIEKWSKFDESLGHGFLIFAIVIVEIFRLSNNYTPKVERRYHSLLLVIIFLAFAHEVSAFWGILIFQQLCFYFLWLVVIGYVLGLNYLKHISFPLAFFLFAVPFWEFSNTFFVNLTTQVVTLFLSFSDLTVYVHQNFIETPYGVIEVAEGCSGIRYFQIGFALAVYATHGERLSLRLKLLVVFTGIALGIITNWIRVIGLIYVGYWSEMQSPLMIEHDNYGFLLFFFVISGVIFLLNYLKKHHECDNREITEVPCSQSINFKAVTFNSILIILFLFSSASLISQRFKIEVPINKAQISLYDDLLISEGSFSEETREIDFLDTTCLLITRQFNYNAKGENVAPYEKIYNGRNYHLIDKDEFLIQINEDNFIAKSIRLKQKKNREVKKLYYWYQLNNYKTTNKYIAKLLEINYLFSSSSKIALNVVMCE